MRASTVIEWEHILQQVDARGIRGMGCVRTEDKWGLCMSGQKLSSYRPAACRCGCASGGWGSVVVVGMIIGKVVGPLTRAY
jgi:hypothetical protein